MDTPRAWVEVDLDALEANLEYLRGELDDGVSILLVAKANAYGHGSVAIAHQALRCGVEGIGVTTSAEALELRASGIRSRIVVLGPILGDEAGRALQSQIELAIPSERLLTKVERAARALGRRARVHAKVDTGMGRLGTDTEETLVVLERIRRSTNLELAGVMTHFAALEGALSPRTRAQTTVFDELLDKARARGLLGDENIWIHAENSAAVLSNPGRNYNAVRIGIAAYGIAPHHMLRTAALCPVLSFRTQVVQLRRLKKGAHVGYGDSWEARRPSVIAVLPVGYDDGVSWRLSNRGHALVRGRRAPIVGRVSMDYTTVDVTDIPGVEPGDRATLLGRDGEATICVEEVAKQIGTIPYEVLCSIGKRVERTFVARTLPQGTHSTQRLPSPGDGVLVPEGRSLPRPHGVQSGARK